MASLTCASTSARCVSVCIGPMRLSLSRPLPGFSFAASQRRQRRGAGGLENDRVAGRDRRCHLVRGEREREVPGHDRPRDADWPAHDQAIGGGVRKRYVLAMDLVGEVCKPGDVLAKALCLEPRLEEGLALLPGQDRGDLL